LIDETKETENKKEGIREFEGQGIQYKDGSPFGFPNELDAVIAAPKNYKVLLENYKVRVLEVTIAPKEIENLHHHQNQLYRHYHHHQMTNLEKYQIHHLNL
jgi:hypothetical protein